MALTSISAYPLAKIILPFDFTADLVPSGDSIAASPTLTATLSKVVLPSGTELTPTSTIASGLTIGTITSKAPIVWVVVTVAALGTAIVGWTYLVECTATTTNGQTVHRVMGVVVQDVGIGYALVSTYPGAILQIAVDFTAALAVVKDGGAPDTFHLTVPNPSATRLPALTPGGTEVAVGLVVAAGLSAPSVTNHEPKIWVSTTLSGSAVVGWTYLLDCQVDTKYGQTLHLVTGVYVRDPAN